MGSQMQLVCVRVYQEAKGVQPPVAAVDRQQLYAATAVWRRASSVTTDLIGRLPAHSHVTMT